MHNYLGIYTMDYEIIVINTQFYKFMKSLSAMTISKNKFKMYMSTII